MRLVIILFLFLIMHACKTKEDDILNTEVKTTIEITKKEAQVYTEQQQEVIDQYVHNCAKKYSYVFNHHEYQECLDRGIKKDSTISYLWQQKAMPYFKARKYEVGLRYLDKAVEINPVGYLSYRGFIHCIFAKNFEAAIEDLEAIKAIEGNSVVMDHSYKFYLALSHLQLNNFEEAEKLLQEDIDEQTKKWGEEEYHHLSMFYLGIAQYEQKNWKKANKTFDKALEKYPMFSDAMYYKSICLYQLSKSDDYYVWYEKAKENGQAGNTISEDNSLYELYPYQIKWH